ncbi:hypothetical protein BX616_010938 [Lobosporangium transversale]|uniref:Uncharacterized protein n=1 Tax=Lobosporangium transversale TaxID=64571 RepID=A0A1Y2GHQ6_9FUNG|nr:hypothetical protein BCR41DRAFT_398845 [Lobosporangium transversale]KAF9910155.1 hypothetical protein BX616_010938 [Lobosporangium transversale]ORZ09406.1 hypothetical protein BCR41DRAFT_398845 [Lobosporangium transversale]|eukprot:XP_021878859.1 hypothetical protein BCR41DRAFT_398845 [Lobosporangium transversale]
MGTTLSRDHAKLPFGYTHARKDHSFNTSSVSRKRLAPRLLRTPDTTSVTPFPIQDGTSSVASIPEMVSQPLPLSTSVHLYESLSSQSANGSNTSHNHSESVHYHHTVPESGTGAGSAAIFSTSPVPESDINETAARTPSIRVRTTVASRTAVGATVTTTTIAATRSASSQANTVHAQHRSMDQAAQITTLSTPASPGSSVLSTSPGQVQTDIVTATITSTEPSTVQNQKSMQLSRTQIGQESEMDVISTLRITDQPNQNPYNFFSSSCQSSHPEPQPHLHRPPMLTKQDSIALFVSGSQLLEMQEQSQKSDEIQMRSTQNNRTIRPDFRAHPSSKRTLSYEVKMTERELQRLQEEDEEFSESWDANTLHLENCRGGETDSILDEELEHLSPIPFSELPSLTNIGLCSHGIVRLSSNIRLLASATCVQM